MRIGSFQARLLQVPLRKSFRHASATRNESHNLIVKCQLVDGTVGWGEGVPRQYVTGESPEQALRNFQCTPLLDQLSSDCHSWTDVVAMLDQLQPWIDVDYLATFPPSSDFLQRGCGANALRAAIELSVLDAYGRHFREPLCNVIGAIPEAAALRRAPQPVRYSVTIDSQDPSRVYKKALAYRIYGFHQCKVKVGDQQDLTRLKQVRRWMGPHVDLRVDANEAWSVHECQEKFAAFARLGVTCVEQPVPHHQLADQARALRDWPIPVMLDESLTGEVDARRAISLGAGQWFNLRISKCGGFIPTLRLAALAQANGIGFQLGCHPGETAILSAAGREWAQVVKGARYLEGSYDRHLLARNIAKEDITFGWGGRAPCLLKPGLGITILEQFFEQEKT